MVYQAKGSAGAVGSAGVCFPAAADPSLFSCAVWISTPSAPLMGRTVRTPLRRHPSRQQPPAAPAACAAPARKRCWAPCGRSSKCAAPRSRCLGCASFSQRQVLPLQSRFELAGPVECNQTGRLRAPPPNLLQAEPLIRWLVNRWPNAIFKRVRPAGCAAPTAAAAVADTERATAASACQPHRLLARFCRSWGRAESSRRWVPSCCS